MKKIYSLSFLFITVIVLVTGCTKTIEDTTPQNNDFSTSSLVQVYVATVNASRNFVYADGAAVNGAALSSGSVFPGTGLYAFQVNAGIRAFLVRDTLPAATQVPLSFAENLQVNRNYTIFMYDTITTPKQKTVETDIVIPAEGTARLRFANFVYTPTGITAVDIFSKKKNANIFTNVQVTDVTPFIPYPAGVNDTFYIRPTGTTTNLQNFVPTPTPGAWADIIGSLNPTAKRSYTLVFRGSYRAMTSTAATVRTLSTFINY